MSLLRDAASFEDRRWRNRLNDWRRDAAVHHLRRVALFLGGVILLLLLVDGARRDLAHGQATVVACQPGAMLRTARGTLSPCFVGQSFTVGDTLITNSGASVTATFPDGTVLQLSPQSQLTLVQSDAFRTGRRFRYFLMPQGEVLCYAPATIETTFGAVPGALQTRRGSLRFRAKDGASISSSTAALSRYAVRPTLLTGLERVVWFPVDVVLSQLGVSGLGTLSGSDAQRLAECRTVALALQRHLKNHPTDAGSYSIEAFPLSSENLTQGQRALQGRLVTLTQGGTAFSATITARDARATRFLITPNQVVEHKIK